ncbi:SRPBCC family protein [Mycolicibacterium grossiae]|uniref:Carbon monoxide dehydrogenase n=1 Tax=Mycolicibacterium grossiae TaxID=1552759 RepID=A0A1E8Q3Z9_9MYCO|nr:SRPBCC family protein [Mycolicibacterium grossiae]OFJ53225.1 carbon monoxide dehydrogenase [Mycolicibacterium grossiae]QEM43779.1 carbon monoxide dehydrogenase [Mycolicibacterium grossiae]
MELNNEFRVAVPAAEVWDVFTDVQRVAPCLPGATLLSVDGDEFTGAVKVKVGPITVSYKGVASYKEKDTDARRLVLRAEGKETRGNGTAAATVTAQLTEDGPRGTHVAISTDLAISGKAAQFGRGVLADVSSNLIAQFARSLEAELLGGGSPDSAAASGVTAAPTTAAPTTERLTAAAQPADSVDLLKVVALPLAKRAAPVAAGLAAGVAVGILFGRRRRTPTHPAAITADDLLAALSKLVS